MDSNSPPVYVIDNPVYEKNDSLSGLDIETVESQGRFEHQVDAVKNFAKRFTKGWPFHTLRIMNLLFILLLAILLTVVSQYWFGLYWSDYWHVLSYHFAIGHEGWVETWMLAIFFWKIFAMAMISSLIFWCNRKDTENSKNLLSCLAITDFCFSVYFILTILNAFLIFAIRSATLYLWFYPRLTNDTMTLAERVEWKEERWEWDNYPPGYRPYPWDVRTTTPPENPTTFSPYQLEKMEEREYQVLARMLLDPTIAILAILAILVNIANCISIRKAIKQTNMWASNYQELNPECTKVIAAYSKFFPVGLFKFCQWLIPAFLFVSMNYSRVIACFSLIFCWAFCFVNWLVYLRMFRFRSSLVKTNDQFVKFDLLCSGAGLGYYLWLWISYSYFFNFPLSLLPITAMAMHFWSILYLISKFENEALFEGGSSQGSKSKIRLPRISINVTVKVIKNEESEEPKKDEVEAQGLVENAEKLEKLEEPS